MHTLGFLTSSQYVIILSSQSLKYYVPKCKSRCYSMCCPSGGKPSGCQPPIPGGGRKIVPPVTCRQGVNIPRNPCMPVYHHGKDTWKKFMYITLFISLPLIVIQTFRSLGEHPPHKTECRDYEYMRRRTKRFPWRDGAESLFHNPDVNYLPGECVPPLLDCD